MPKAAKKKPAKTKTSATKTSAYDVAAHLRTPKEIAAYLDAWLEKAPEDAAGFVRALGDTARAKGMSQVAGDAGLSRESLERALSAAKLAAEATPPNYFLAGNLTGACTSCHQDDSPIASHRGTP